ncbi:MAG: hypothetical protein IKX71_09155 [Bacteroidales bacterium]|nr:hypothetical protein [Bacteroidales bacterium]
MKTLKTILLWIIGLLAVLCIAVAIIWSREIATLCTVKPVDGNEYLY